MPYSLDEVVDRITNHLEDTIRTALGNPLAAVLIPLYEKQSQAHVLLTERAPTLRKHSGQISFPGGKIEAQDLSVVDTATRETHEEIGLAPTELDIIDLFHDFATPYYPAVTPVIGTFPYPQDFTLQKSEIAQILEVPLTDLLDPEIHHTEIWEHDNRNYTLHFYEWQDDKGSSHTIWGATAGVLHQLLDIIRSE